MLLMQVPNIRTALLIVVVIWSSCRFYYFCFYVIEKYVDPELKFSGIVSMVTNLFVRRSKRW